MNRDDRSRCPAGSVPAGSVGGSVPVIQGQAVLVAGGLDAGLVAQVEVLRPDLGLPDLHAVLVLIRRLGAGPPHELGQPIEMIGEEPAEGIATGPGCERLVV